MADVGCSLWGVPFIVFIKRNDNLISNLDLINNPQMKRLVTSHGDVFFLAYRTLNIRH